MLLPVMQNSQTKASDVNKSKNVALGLIFGGFVTRTGVIIFKNMGFKTSLVKVSCHYYKQKRDSALHRQHYSSNFGKV